MPKWLHVGRYALPGEPGGDAIEQVIQPLPSVAGDCADTNDNCEAWSVTSECDKNPAFMLGSIERPGACLKSCGRCDIFKAWKAAQLAATAKLAGGAAAGGGIGGSLRSGVALAKH
jgi:hypothetical protein